MQFNFTYSPTVTQNQIVAFELAGRIWSSYLTDNVTVNIAVDFQTGFAGNVIAGAISRSNDKKFSDYKNAIENDVTSEVDEDAIDDDSMLTKADITAQFNTITPQQRRSDAVKKGQTLSVNGANAKALDLDINNAGNLLDGFIVMRDLTGTNTSWDYNFTRTGITPSNSVDFISVAIHEIGHVLGFQSSVDIPLLLPNIGFSSLLSAADLKAYNDQLSKRVNDVTPLDLFRYSQQSEDSEYIDLSVGGTPFLLLDDEIIGYFDTGVNTALGGNGKQASHWSSGGIMNSEISRGSRPVITAQDLIAFDAIGWDVAQGGINRFINYNLLYQQALQAASTKQTKELGSLVGQMLDNTGDMKAARAGGFWQTFFAARAGGFWQSFKQTMSDQSLMSLFDTLDGDIYELAASQANPQLQTSTNPLTGTTEGALLAGNIEEINSFLGANPNQAFIDWGFSQSPLGFGNSDFAGLQQPVASVEIGANPTSNLSLGENMSLGTKSTLTSVLAENTSLTATKPFAPWWLGETAWWTVR